MRFKILICGLPDNGKTTLAEQLYKELNCVWFNADKVRSYYNDWDFSENGRKRQAHRIFHLCSGEYCYIADFVAPTEDIRNIFQADFVIWMNTNEKGRFEDTNKIFEKSGKFDLEIKSFDYNIKDIITKIKGEYESIQ